MGIDIESYRQRIGNFHGAVKEMKDNLHIFIIIAMLLLMSGIEPNPGPDEYKCRYCSERSSRCENVIMHCIESHAKDTLKVMKFQTNGWQSISFGLIPDDVKKTGGHIWVSPGIADIYVTHGMEEEEPPAKKSRTSCSHDDLLINKIIELLPDVIDKFKQHDVDMLFLTFLEQVRAGIFPMQNIAFLLFLDIVKWFSLDNSSKMRYSNTVKSFFRMGLLMFGPKLLRFLGGPKNKGECISMETKAGCYSPASSKVNFIVPSVECLKGPDTLHPKNLNPGIFRQVIDNYVKHIDPNLTKSHKLIVDLKKINPRTKDELGEVNLFGHEDKPTFDDRRRQLNLEKEAIETLRANVIKLQSDSDDINEDTLVISQKVIYYISCRVREIRNALISKEYGLKRIMQKTELEGYKDWKKCKYSSLISYLKSVIIEMKECICNLLDMNDTLASLLAIMNNRETSFSTGASIEMSQQQNYKCLLGGTTKTEHIKQRSSDWFELRKGFIATASTLNDALGLRTLSSQKEHFEHVVMGKNKKEASEQVKEYMDWGVINEVNAAATTVSKILPALYPGVIFCDVGSYTSMHDNKKYLLASPDGVGVTVGDSVTDMLFEFKCPVQGKGFTTPVLYDIPCYYIPQLLCQMALSNCHRTLFVSYSPQSSTAFTVAFDPALWELMDAEIRRVYIENRSKRPQKKSDPSKHISEKIKDFMNTNVEFIGEFKSIKGIPCNHDSREHRTSDGVHGDHEHGENRSLCRKSLSGIQYQLDGLSELLTEAGRLTRPRPRDVMVFMVSDLDRAYNNSLPHAIPIAYGISGPSLKAETVMKMFDMVLKCLRDKGLHVPVLSFDGQFAKEALRGVVSQPLTILQLMKDVWKDAMGTDKNDLREALFDANKVKVNSITDVKDLLEIQIQCDSQGNIHSPIIVGGVKDNSRIYSMSNRTFELFKRDILGTTHMEQVIDIQQQNDSPQIEDHVLDSVVLDGVDECVMQEIQSINHEITHQMEIQAHEDDHEMVDGCDVLNGKALTDNEYQVMLNAAKFENETKFSELSLDHFKSFFATAKGIDKAFFLPELRSCQRMVQEKLKNANKKCTLSCSKTILVNTFSKLVGDGSFIESKNRGRCTVKSPPELSQIIRTMLCKKIVKYTLNIWWSENEFVVREKEWRRNAIIKDDVKIDGTELPLKWFTQPKVRGTETEFAFLDSHHELVNSRCHVCRRGFQDAGIKREAFLKVAKENKQNKTGLNRAIVEDVIDPQDNATAQILYSEKVQKELEKNGDTNEAKLCYIMRNWYEACDKKGLTPMDRINRWLNLREWLLSLLNTSIGKFPPPGSHVHDIPIILFEALLLSCERHIQLYGYAKGNTYNPRAVGTQDIENFFSCFQDLDPAGQGVLRPDDIPRVLSCALEVLQTKMDSQRGFHFSTTASRPVYKTDELEKCAVDESDMDCPGMDSTTSLDAIRFRSHPVSDVPTNIKPKRKTGKVNAPEEGVHGAMGIRRYHKRKEEDVLYHVRANINLDELSEL